MKKLILYAAVALTIVSCGPKSADKNASAQDSIVTVDTIKADTVKVDSATVKVDTTVVKK